jgi:hypothetical protein
MYLLFVLESKDAGNFVPVILITETSAVSLNAGKTNEMFGSNRFWCQKLYI